MTNRITVFKEQKQLTEHHPIRKGRIKIEETLTRGFINAIQDKKEVKSFSEPKEPENNFNPDLDDEIDI